MGLLSKITKPIKKALKSPLGKAALLAATYRYAPAMWGKELGGSGGWGAGWEKFQPWLMGTADKGGVHNTATGNLWQRMGPWGKAATVGIGAAGVGAATLPDEEDLPEEFTDDSGQQQYLTNRALFEDEWSDWLVDMGKAADKAEALEMVRSNPMFSQGGRVKAQGGLFAGQMPGRHPGMNQMRNPNMNPMGMNQGLGAPNLGPRSMGMTPGGGAPGGGQMDPRMAQMMQGRGRPTTVPKESEDTELIQLIKMLTSLGIPMEQLRGRTKEELVEMLVSVSGKMGGEQQGRPEVEEEVVEEEVVQAAQGGIARTGYALGTPVIPSKDGMQLDMRDSGGYQPHGKAEKHDDVRALLAQGEFVMTSDAVKGMGGGDREVGAKKMYNLMHNMEAMA